MSAWRFMSHQARVVAVRGCLNEGGMAAPEIAERYGAPLPALEWFMERHAEVLGIPAGPPAPRPLETLTGSQGSASAPGDDGANAPTQEALYEQPPATPGAVASAPGTLPEAEGEDGDSPVARLRSWDCRYIAGDPREPGWEFCGAPRQPGSSYCADHHARCYTRVPIVSKRRGRRVARQMESA